MSGASAPPHHAELRLQQQLAAEQKKLWETEAALQTARMEIAALKSRTDDLAMGVKQAEEKTAAGGGPAGRPGPDPRRRCPYRRGPGPPGEHRRTATGRSWRSLWPRARFGA
jgi:hypothetical protein